MVSMCLDIRMWRYWYISVFSVWVFMYRGVNVLRSKVLELPGVNVFRCQGVEVSACQCVCLGVRVLRYLGASDGVEVPSVSVF